MDLAMILAWYLQRTGYKGSIALHVVAYSVSKILLRIHGGGCTGGLIYPL